ncbi:MULTISPECIES: glycosyltransferase [unclassified Leifsonia]|uniref:glycosyltransferase n=1 Tax=unclassified Leifsonia TaxID=2663824 RepID=UPI000700E7F3|nr:MULTISPECIES: glycosyltransferase [unclassified Leifsonia]KQX08043.1 hypothetical protein ASC59_10170 [Leifsonia sp. Root1293]KRA12324.1 hypothetical protein ASD61_10170 [Leifsonia sp. Root60]
MSSPASSRSLRVLVAHPGAELFGSDRMLVESVAGLRAAGHAVLVTVPTGGPMLDVVRAMGATVVITPTLVLRKSLIAPTGWLKLISGTVRGLVAGIRLALRARPDVIYVNTVTIPLWIAVGRVTGRPVLCHVHEAERSARPVVRRALSAPVLFARTVVANSAFSAGVLEDSFPELGPRVGVVANGVAGPAETTKARDGIDGPLRVLYVGRLSDRKGVDVAIAALAELRRGGTPAELEVVGSVFAGNEEYEEALRDQIRDEGLGGAVSMLGFQPDVWDAYRRCDVAVVPSRVDEPFGNTAVESLLAGRPVVVSDTSGLREASSGFESAQRVRPGDAGALASALRRVYDDWPTFRDAALVDREVAHSRHSTELYRTRMAAAVEATAAGRPWGAGDSDVGT